MSNGWNAIPRVNFKERMDDWAPADSDGYRHVRWGELRMEEVAKYVMRVNQSTPVLEEIEDRWARVDGLRADVPYGGTPVIAAGYRLFPKTKGIVADEQAKDAKVRPMPHELAEEYDVRDQKVQKYVFRFVQLHARLEPDPADVRLHALWEAEKHQVLTGGGYDGGQMGDVTLDFLKFFERTWRPVVLPDGTKKIVVEVANNLKTYLKQAGVEFGNAKPSAFESVRLEQNRDGLIGFPLYCHAFDSLTEDLAARIRMFFHVGVDWMLSGPVCSDYATEPHEAKVVDALSFVASREATLSTKDYPNIMTGLKRTQRHGYTMDEAYNPYTSPDADYKCIKRKKAKIRSIKCPDAATTLFEGCIFNAIQNALKEHPTNAFNSLLAPEIRREMLADLVSRWTEADLTSQSLDWSKWDASVVADIYVTIMDIVFGDFFAPEYRSLFDFAMHNHVFKYCIFRRDLVTRGDSAKIARQLRQKGAVIDLTAGLSLIGGVGGMGSGLKGTYVGNSTYGLCLHEILPRLAYGESWGFGCQTGDDTVAPLHKKYFDAGSSEKTLRPMADIAASLNLELNVDKLVWVPTPSGIMTVYLQEYTAPELDIRGIGSAFRYGPSAFTGEYPLEGGFLTHSSAVISKVENGANNPFLPDVAEEVLNSDLELSAILQCHGESSLDKLVQAAGRENVENALFAEGKQFRLDAQAFLEGRAKCLPTLCAVARERVKVPQKAADRALRALEMGKGYSDSLTQETLDEELERLSDNDE